MTFISEEELSSHLNDGRYVAQKASEHIRCLETELERTKAVADASSITAEQTCSILEQKFLSLSTEFENLEARYGHLQLSYDHRVTEVADVQAQKHQLSLLSIEKDGEIERLMTELSEVNKSKRQLMELIGLKDSEIAEKNASLNSYLDKIVNITEQGTKREARLSEVEVELSRAQAASSRVTQEKELVERHNTWLNDELSTKISSFLELRKNHVELQEEMSAKTSDYEKTLADCSKSLKWNKEKVKELESKLSLLQEELSLSKEASASTEERLSAELSTVNKLVELYKENSEEWSRKSGELEGVIKALEIHASQVEDDYKGKLETETSLRKTLEKDLLDLKEKFDRAEAEVEKRRKEDELHLSPVANFASERWIEAYGLEKNVDDDGSIVPKIPAGVSGTALAASLLRDGWSLAKMYSKYQEAVDALRHEQLGRKESEAVLQRVLCELEEKAGIILDERAEYERMVESYAIINKNLQRSFEEKANLEKINQELKVDLRRSERDSNLAQKDIADLQKQITILVKECRDLQLHCGGADTDQYLGDTDSAFEVTVDSDVESVISTHLLTFRDINGLVGQNAQLRRLVRDLSEQIEHKEKRFEEQLEAALRNQAKEAETKVEAVISRAEEQGRMIESLHTSVAMYKRLYEEEHNLHTSCSHHPHTSPAVSHSGRKDLLVYLEDSQEANKKAQEKSAERLRLLEDDLAKARSDLIFMRAEREKSDLEAKFAREKLESFLKEYDFQRSEMNGISTRNIELSHLLVEYQKKLRECSDNLNLSEENSRKYNMELNILKQEKEMLLNSEKRACDEVRSLSERVYRLQASLDTIQSAEEIREDARVAERKKQDEYVKHLEREWAEAKKELQQERDNLRALTFERELTLKNSGTQFEELSKELAKALTATTAAESRASIAEAKLSDLERKLTSKNKISDVVDGDGNSSYSSTEVVTDLLLAKKEIEKLKDEVRANKDHMLQYKSIAQVNEGALKQMEAAHHTYKIESERLKESLEAELHSLRSRIIELEDELISKVNEVSVATTGREEALASVYSEVASLKEEISNKILQNTLLESENCALKEDLENERAKRCTAQGNYERQVILQSETIQELTRTSELLASMQQEAAELRKSVHALKSENIELKAKWDGEKEFLETSVRNAEKKYQELNEQNKILHDRLEALHIQLAEKHRLSAAISTEGTGADSHENGSLQNVINYLRRSKEIGETEISLLKQEKLRLQSQLETALKTVEKTQSLLHAERESSKAILFTEDEIKSMQLQIREINLLRESNTQLREENKHNFEECQKIRELYQKTQGEMLKLETLVREKDIEIEAGKKTLELELLKKDDAEKKLSELIERSRIVDVEEYDQIQSELQEFKEKMKEKNEKMQEMHEAELKLQETVSRLDKDISKLKAEFDDSLQTETRLRADIERQKKFLINWKKKWDTLSKEKDDLTEEKQSLLKQIEELKQVSRRPAGSVAGELGSKDKEEKDHRIQILEKTVERQREELRKREERASLPTRQSNLDLVKDFSLTRSKVEQQKLALEGFLNNNSEATLPEDIPRFCLSVLDDFTSYFSSVENPAVSSEPVLPDTSGPTAASQAPPTITVGKSVDDSNQNASVAKIPVEPRRLARRLVRPKLVTPEDSQPDADLSITQPNDSDSLPTQIHRKRLVPSTPDPVEPIETTLEATTPALKKPKSSDITPLDSEKAGLSPDDFLEVVIEPTEVPKDDAVLEKDMDVPAAESKETEVEMQVDVPNETEVVDTEDDLKSQNMVEHQLDSDKEEGELLDVPENEEVNPDQSDLLDDAPELTSPASLDEEPVKEDDISMSDAPSEGSPLAASAVDVAANAEVEVTRQVPESEEAKQVSPVGIGSRVVNLAERAKERAMLRQFGSGSLPPSRSGARARGDRARGVRGARGATRGSRGQSSGSQGYQ